MNLKFEAGSFFRTKINLYRASGDMIPRRTVFEFMGLDKQFDPVFFNNEYGYVTFTRDQVVSI